MLFVTTPKSSNNNNNKEIHSPSATVRMVTGEPDVDIPVEMESSRVESRGQVGAMGVSVCGRCGEETDRQGGGMG